MSHSWDCIVAGAGTAGITAAIQCGRAGLHTLLLERSGQPGGTMTSSLIAYPGLFYGWKKQIIAGIGWELVTRCVRLSGTELPRFEEQEGLLQHSCYQVKLNPFLYAALCDEELQKAGVTVRYHTIPVKVRRQAERWCVTLASQDGEEDVECTELIDCTGDAAVTALAGFERRYPETPQPATYSFHLSGYDPDQLDFESIQRAAVRAVANAELRFADLGWNATGFSRQLLECFGNNANHLFITAAATVEARSLAEQEGRASMLRAYRFLKAQPGLERLHLDYAAPECGIRESAVIVGEHMVTAAEYCAGTPYPDSIAYTLYPIDLHQKGVCGVTPKVLKDGTLPTIPLRALIPQKSRHLLAAGRIIASDREANSALRVQASCMAMGQAAGAAAALAIRHHVTPGEVDIAELKVLLKNHRAIVP